MSASAITANPNANIINICIYKVRIGQNSCQMTQKHTFFEKRVKKFWKFRNSYYFCAPKQTGCSSARLEYTSGGRVVAGSNPVIPTMLSAKPSIARSEVFVFYAPCACTIGALKNKKARSLTKGVLPRHCNLAKGTRGKALSEADRVCEVANPVIPTMLSAKPSIARSEVFVFMFVAGVFAYHNKRLRDILHKMSRSLFLQLNEKK